MPLSTNTIVNTLLQDEDGQIWAGGSEGVYRLEDEAWQPVNQGLSGASVYALLQDEQGQIWAGGTGGVYRLEGEGWQPVNQGLPEGLFNIRALLQDERGQIWAGGSEGVYRLEDEAWQPVNQGLSGASVYALLQDERGQIWAGGSEGVYRLEDEAWQPVNQGLLGGSVSVRTLLQVEEGQIWAGVREGVYRLEGEAWQPVNQGLIEGWFSMRPLLQDEQGQIWTGLVGVYRFEDEAWQPTNRGLEGWFIVNALLQDEDGQIWAGGSEGVYRLEYEAWQPVNQGLSGASVYALLQDKGGQIWAGGSEGVYRLESQAWQPVNQALTQGPIGAWVYALLQDEEGQIWVGSSEGVYRLEGETWQPINQGLNEGWFRVRALLQDEQGQIWAGLDSGEGVYRLVDDQWQPANQGLPKVSVSALLQDKHGRIWAGLDSGEGVYRLEGEAWEATNEGLPEDRFTVRALLQDEQGQIWAGLGYGEGVYRLEGKAWQPVNQGLSGAWVRALLQDEQGQIWAGGSGMDNRSVYSYDTGTGRWTPAARIHDYPNTIHSKPKEIGGDHEPYDLILTFSNQRVLHYSKTSSDSWSPTGLSPDIYWDYQHAESLDFVLGMRKNIAILSQDNSPLWIDYVQNRLWISPDQGLSWNPIAKANLPQAPLGANYDQDTGSVRIWTMPSRDIIQEYMIPSVPFYARWKPLAFLLALGRSPIYWNTLLTLAIISLLYLGSVYLFAGRSNRISLRDFLQLDWGEPKLLSLLISRGEDSYTALRLAIKEISPLAKSGYLLLEPKKTNPWRSVQARFAEADLAVDQADLSAALRELSTRKLFLAEGEGYRYPQPQLAQVYRQATSDEERKELFENVRTQNPAYVDTVRFFEQNGLNLVAEAGTTLTFKVQNQDLAAQLDDHVLVRIFGDQPIKGAQVQSLAEAAKQSFRGELEGKFGFMILCQPPEAGARAQMFAYRWDKSFTVIPINRARLRAALTENIAASELGNILGDYLAKRPDLYNRSNPVRDENFFGRLQISEELIAYLDEGQPVGVFALNKMGKTSLIRNLAERLTDRAVTVVDLQLNPDPRSVYEAVIKGLANDIEYKWPQADQSDLQLVKTEIHDENFTEVFIRDLRRLHQALAAVCTSPRFVVFIDEIDRLIPEKMESGDRLAEVNHLLAALRGLGQEGIPFTFVGVGIRAHINRQVQIAGRENAGFQMFHERFLPPMTRVECDQMIVDIGKQMGLKYTDAALATIYAESGGHPFLARQLCSQAWALLSEEHQSDRHITIDEAIIQAAVGDYLNDGRQSAYHQSTWETRLSEAERNIVRRLAAAEEPQTLQKGERMTMNALVERHLVIKENDTYRLAFDLFRRWVRLYILDLEED